MRKYNFEQTLLFYYSGNDGPAQKTHIKLDNITLQNIITVVERQIFTNFYETEKCEFSNIHFKNILGTQDIFNLKGWKSRLIIYKL